MHQGSLITRSSSIEILALELDMKDMAYATAVWSLQEFEFNEYVQALSTKRDEVLEIYKDYSQINNYSHEQVQRLQIVVAAMGEGKVIDFWTVLHHMYNFLFVEDF